MSGKQIKLFLVDGTPGGLSTAEITNWTGHVLTAPRSQLAELLRRHEATRTGVYLLLGDDESAIGGVRCYIGEADAVGDRLRQHHREKDFWERVVVITSKDTNLTKSHGRYLESRLILLATQAARASVENSTAPGAPPLPESDASDMDYFLEQLHIVLPVLGINAFRSRATSIEPAAASDSPIFRLVNARSRVDASAQQIDGEFTVLAGSKIVAEWSATGTAATTMKAYASYRAQHQKLIADGAISVADGVGLTTRDIVFTSPSTAGAVSLGRSCNGRIEWVSSGGTFGAWESRGLTP